MKLGTGRNQNQRVFGTLALMGSCWWWNRT